MTSKTYFLHEGQFMITSLPSEIMTVLGSCVSVCLWDKARNIGGMNHYLLPGNKQDIAGNASLGYSSIRMLIRSMLNRQSSIENLEAKIFGGCNSIYKDDTFTVGQRNIDIAIQSLQEAGIQIVVNHTGGKCGRKVVFNTQTGAVKMKFVS